MPGRTVIKTKIKSVMIVTKARDHNLVQITRDLALWLMTTPRHGKLYGIKVYVDAKLEHSKRFDANGLCKDHSIIGEKKLLQFWTPETCVYADAFDFVITVRLSMRFLIIAWWGWDSTIYFVALSADCPANHVVQFWISRISNQFSSQQYACRSRPMPQRRVQSQHAYEIHLHSLSFCETKCRTPRSRAIRRYPPTWF